MTVKQVRAFCHTPDKSQFFQHRIGIYQMKRTICGVGKNDADYKLNPRREDGTVECCPIFQLWASIIGTHYGKKNHENNPEDKPDFKETVMSDEWLNSFMSFRAWYLTNYRNNSKIDRRILGNHNVYSATTCLCISQQLYGFIRPKNRRNNIRETIDGLFEVCCSDPSGREKSFVGLYPTLDQARETWLDRKLEYAYQFKPELERLGVDHFSKLLELIKTMK